jgi:hypothetical protein
VLIGAISVAGAIRVRNATNEITVTGSARQSVASDEVVWSASLTSTQATTADALRELSGWLDRARTALRDSGAHDDEVVLDPVAAVPNTDRTANGSDTGKVISYTLTRTFNVHSFRVADMAKVFDAASTLLAQGVPFTAQRPQYFYSGLAKLRPELLAEATRDAHTRAQALLKVSGGRVGQARDVKAGVIQVTASGATDVSGGGVYDTSTITKDVTAVVSVTFSLS